MLNLKRLHTLAHGVALPSWAVAYMCEFDFDRIVSRRAVLLGGTAFGVVAFADAVLPPNAEAVPMDFEPVGANQDDTITLPKGYTWHLVASWGDPLWSSGQDFDPTSRGTAESQAMAFGDNNDGMSCFAVDGRIVLAVNNEYTNTKVIWGNRTSNSHENADDVRKGMNAHGVSLMEIRRGDQGWQVVKDSPLNRRITPETPMDVTGPGRAHPLLKTQDDPHGVLVQGTFNNCGNGRTPWGTYLTCEENFHAYFHSPSKADWTPTDMLKRYGLKASNDRYGWATVEKRFDLALEANEPNRHGYIVEIDPADPASRPRKHTAMGRFKHENCEMVVAGDGHIVAYMGDDERGEHLYKFISRKTYHQGMENPSSLLEDGTLYAARFDENGTGTWLPLTPESTGMSPGEICIHTRQAATAVGATTMDRPEWVAANPQAVEAYCCLTNNKDRGQHPNQPVNAVNPRPNNQYGHIVRWIPANGNHSSHGFKWDLFVMAGNPTVHMGAKSGSRAITAENMFNSPDGLAFDSKGRLWIQTDGNDSNKGDFAGMGNNQMLVADTRTSTIRRFMVGPTGCEVTGITWSPDQKTMFVGIQHPGGHFPAGGSRVPRSSVIAIEKPGFLGVGLGAMG